MVVRMRIRSVGAVTFPTKKQAFSAIQMYTLLGEDVTYYCGNDELVFHAYRRCTTSELAQTVLLAERKEVNNDSITAD